MDWIIIIAIIAAIVVGIMFLLKFLGNVQPDELEVEQHLKDLKASVAQYKGGFIPWSADKISARDIDQILTKSEKNARIGSGVFMSRDNEPIFAYAFRNYIGPGKNAVIYILSLEHEYVFRITNKGTEITKDGQKQGLIRENGVLYDVRNNEIAKVQRSGATATNKILIGEKEVAKIALPESIAPEHALELVELDLQPTEQEIVKTMTVYELVTNIGQLEG